MLLLTSWIPSTPQPMRRTLSIPFLIWGWRIPFLLSIVMVAVGLYVRFKLEDPRLRQRLQLTTKG